MVSLVESKMSKVNKLLGSWSTKAFLIAPMPKFMPKVEHAAASSIERN